MNCSRCNQLIREGDRFCQWCGEPVSAASSPDSPGSATGKPATGASVPAEPATTDRELREFRADLGSVAIEVSRLSRRLSDLERRSGRAAAVDPPQRPAQSDPGTPMAEPPVTAPPPSPATTAPYDRRQEPGSTVPVPVGQRDAVMGRARRQPVLPTAMGEAAGAVGSGINVPRVPAVNLPNWNWEWLVGGNWLARIGVVALIFGVAFLISLAIDRGWLGEIERVVLGVAGGLALLGAGEYWRRRYGVWAQTVTGGGLAILYLSIYGAFALYELISPLTAFAGFSVITLAGSLLSLRHEAVTVAVFSIFGGFATPLLLQERLPDQRLLLAYVLVLDVGVLALAGFRNWRWFTLLAWVGSLVLFGFWHEELEPPVALAQIGITAIFLVFVAATAVFHLVRRQA